MGIPSATLSMLVVAASVSAAQEFDLPSASAALAPKLAALMQARSLDSIAAEDPDEEGRYIAALVFPNAQIFAITGRYSVPVLMNERLMKGEFRDAYVELNQAADRKGRLFVQDYGLDGLQPTRDATSRFDIIYEHSVDKVQFDGEWKTQKLTRESYLKKFEVSDARYAHMLQVLIAQLETTAAPISMEASEGR
jgi:hypothetical protein